jgi:predicted DNA-binding ribbon-helix-helix protein
MRRTQIYLEEGIYNTLKVISKTRRTTVSELIRQAIRVMYKDQKQNKIEKFDNACGIWAKRDDLRNPSKYVRGLRKGRRLERLGLK